MVLLFMSSCKVLWGYAVILPACYFFQYKSNDYNSLPESFPTNSVDDEVDGTVENNHVIAEDVVIPLEIRT